MALNAIIREMHGGASPTEESDLGDDGRPEPSRPETTMVSETMMPPYFHNQWFSERGMMSLLAGGMAIIWMLNMVV